MVRCSTDVWITCGYITIPEHTRVVVVGKDNHWAKLEHRGSNVQLKCNSNYVQQDCTLYSQNLDVTLRILSALDDQETIPHGEAFSVSITAPCFAVVCQWNPTILLRAIPGSRVYFDGDELNEYITMQESDGIINIHVDDRLSVGSERYWIKIVSPISPLSVDNFTKTDEIYITQFLPFDLRSCTNIAKVAPGDRHSLSLLPLRKNLQTEASPKAEKIVSKTTNDIHDVRVGSALNSLVHDKLHLSESLVRLKRVTNSPPRFDQLHYNIQFEENNDIGDVVTTAYAGDTDSGSLGNVVYSLTSNDGNTDALFSIGLESGVITAEGKCLTVHSLDVCLKGG